MDRGAVRAAQQHGRGRDHDGGGRILHTVRRSLALPPEAGKRLGDEARSVGQGCPGAPPPLVPLGFCLLWKVESGCCQVKNFNESIFLLVLPALMPSHLNAKGACRGESGLLGGSRRHGRFSKAHHGL